MICGNCGHHVAVGVKFCPRCGSKLKTMLSDETVLKPEVSSIQGDDIGRDNENHDSAVTSEIDTRDNGQAQTEQNSDSRAQKECGSNGNNFSCETEKKEIMNQPLPRRKPVTIAIAILGVLVLFLILGMGFSRKKDKELIGKSMASGEQEEVQRSDSTVIESTSQKSYESTEKKTSEATSTTIFEETKEDGVSPDTKVGDMLLLGRYEQDGRLANGPESIEWIVLDKVDDRYLLLSRYCLDNMSYSDDASKITWAESSIREWLNGNFYYSAFSASEREAIVETTLGSEKDLMYGISYGKSTIDCVFLLSQSEVETYFHTNEERRTINTVYAEKQMISAMVKSVFYPNTEIEAEKQVQSWDQTFGIERCSWWWTRFPASYRIAADGSVGLEGDAVNLKVHGLNSVRPAIWVQSSGK